MNPISETHYLKLHSSCVAVAGKSRAIIYDLQNASFDFIPLDMYELLQLLEKSPVSDVKKNISTENQEIFHEYLEFLLTNRYAFICEEREYAWFPKIDYKYMSPHFVNNCIVDVGENSKHNWVEISRQLNELMCADIQIRYYSIVELATLKGLLEVFDGTTVKNIDLLVPYNSADSIEALIEFLDSDNRLTALTIHTDKLNKVNVSKKGKNLFQTEQQIDGNRHCGTVHAAFFSVNRSAFSECLMFNSCLNKKISIDVNGDIKNCPSMKKVYGNIYSSELQQILRMSDFQSLWFVKKDEIATCSECEFRYMCIDCRAFVQNPDDCFSKPLKCGYNPDTCEWEEWSENPLSKYAINFYNLEDMIKKSEIS